MVVKKIHEAGVTSDIAYTAAFGSILLSIGIWLTYKSDEPGHAERLGIFVGLWAPTLAVGGLALERYEDSLDGHITSATKSVERVENAVKKALED